MPQGKKKKSTDRLGRSWKELSEKKMAEQDSKLLQSVNQLVESGLEQSHQTRFKNADVDTMDKYKFDLHVPTGAVSKLGIKVTRKQTVDETRLAIRRIDIHDRSLINCNRQRPINNDNYNKLRCALFGPTLCPDCVQLTDQAEFTEKQELVYPQISVHTHYMVAGGRLTKQKSQTTNKGLIVSPFKRHVDINVLDGVVTDEDIHKRIKQKHTAVQNKLAIEGSGSDLKYKTNSSENDQKYDLFMAFLRKS